MGSTSRKLRRQSDKLGAAQNKTFTEDDAFRHVIGYAPPTHTNDLKDAVSDFLIEPNKHPVPTAVVKKWQWFGGGKDALVDQLINIFAYTENLAMGMLDCLAPGAGRVMQEELYDLVPDQNDAEAAKVREVLLSSDDGIANMRHWVWGYSVAQREESERETTDEERKIQKACSAVERAKIWPSMRVRADDHEQRLNRIDAGFVLRYIHPLWDPVTQSTNNDEESLQAWAREVEDPDLVEDTPKREKRLEETLREYSRRRLTLSELVYRSITLAYTALEQQQPGLGEAYVEEMTGEKYSDLTGAHKLHLVEDDGAP